MNDKLIGEMIFHNVGFTSVLEFSFGFCRKVQVSWKGYLCGLLFALAFFVLPFPVSAQPAISRGEQLLSINYDECMRRAENAFTNEDWVNIGKGGAFVTAFKENNSACIMCNVAPENKIWVNIVVASLSRDDSVPGAERVKLQKWMDQSVADANIVFGTWSGNYRNSKGNSGYASMTFSKSADGKITGSEDNVSFDKMKVSNNVVSFKYKLSGCRTVEGTLIINPDGKTASGSYTVTECNGTDKYTGSYTDYKKQ